MKVHFAASTSNLKQDIEDYRLILKAIADCGHFMVRDWVDKHYAYSQGKGSADGLDWIQIYQENLEAIAHADLVIIEASRKSFSTGFQTALAIRSKKPTLLITKNNALSGTFGSGIRSDLVQYKKYTPAFVGDVLSDFFNQHDLKQKDLRFNFFIDRKIHNYLAWASMNTGKTKAEIVRELLEAEIDSRDGLI